MIGRFTPEFVMALPHGEREAYIAEVDDIKRRQAEASKPKKPPR